MRLMALLVVAMFGAILAYQKATLQSVTPNAQDVLNASTARQFLSYKSAVMAFMNANPTFTGTISTTQLSAYYPQYSSNFVGTYGVSNAVTVSGTGRMITSYAALPTGALQQVLVQSNNDASVGTSNGTTWTTDANGVNRTPQTLNTAVPAGDVVYVAKTGV